MGKIKMALLLMDHLCKPWFESYWITSPDPYLHHASVPEWLCVIIAKKISPDNN